MSVAMVKAKKPVESAQGSKNHARLVRLRQRTQLENNVFEPEETPAMGINTRRHFHRKLDRDYTRRQIKSLMAKHVKEQKREHKQPLHPEGSGERVHNSHTEHSGPVICATELPLIEPVAGIDVKELRRRTRDQDNLTCASVVEHEKDDYTDVSQQKLKHLTDMGFEVEVAAHALRYSTGDKIKAAQLLCGDTPDAVFSDNNHPPPEPNIALVYFTAIYVSMDVHVKKNPKPKVKSIREESQNLNSTSVQVPSYLSALAAVPLIPPEEIIASCGKKARIPDIIRVFMKYPYWARMKVRHIASESRACIEIFFQPIPIHFVFFGSDGVYQKHIIVSFTTKEDLSKAIAIRHGKKLLSHEVTMTKLPYEAFYEAMLYHGARRDEFPFTQQEYAIIQAEVEANNHVTAGKNPYQKFLLTRRISKKQLAEFFGDITPDRTIKLFTDHTQTPILTVYEGCSFRTAQRYKRALALNGTVFNGRTISVTPLSVEEFRLYMLKQSVSDEVFEKRSSKNRRRRRSGRRQTNMKKEKSSPELAAVVSDEIASRLTFDTLSENEGDHTPLYEELKCNGVYGSMDDDDDRYSYSNGDDDEMIQHMMNSSSNSNEDSGKNEGMDVEEEEYELFQQFAQQIQPSGETEKPPIPPVAQESKSASRTLSYAAKLCASLSNSNIIQKHISTANTANTASNTATIIHNTNPNTLTDTNSLNSNAEQTSLAAYNYVQPGSAPTPPVYSLSPPNSILSCATDISLLQYSRQQTPPKYSYTNSYSNISNGLPFAQVPIPPGFGPRSLTPVLSIPFTVTDPATTLQQLIPASTSVPDYRSPPPSSSHANSLYEYLESINLRACIAKFQTEEITSFETLLMLEREHLQELGLPMGHRIRIQKLLQEFARTGIDPTLQLHRR